MSTKNRRSKDTEQALMRAFWEELRHRPLEKIRVTRLCCATGLDRTTFYLHYCDIYQLMEAFEAKQLEDIRLHIREMKPGLLEGQEVVRRILMYINEHRELLLVLKREGRSRFWEQVREELQSYFLLSVRQAYPQVNQWPERELEDTIVFLTNGFYGIYRQWLEKDSPQDLEYLASLSARLSDACLQVRMKEENR